MRVATDIGGGHADFMQPDGSGCDAHAAIDADGQWQPIARLTVPYGGAPLRLHARWQ